MTGSNGLRSEGRSAPELQLPPEGHWEVGIPLVQLEYASNSRGLLRSIPVVRRDKLMPRAIEIIGLNGEARGNTAFARRA